MAKLFVNFPHVAEDGKFYDVGTQREVAEHLVDLLLLPEGNLVKYILISRGTPAKVEAPAPAVVEETTPEVVAETETPAEPVVKETKKKK